MPKARKGLVVYFTYSIQGEDGEVLEQNDLPIGIILGAGSGVFEKIEEAIEGHGAGETVRVTLEPEEAFGPHREELTCTQPIEQVPPQYRQVGAEVEFVNERGETRTFVVSRIEDGRVTLDGNHPLAGQRLTYVVRILEVRRPTMSEVTAGQPLGPPGGH